LADVEEASVQEQLRAMARIVRADRRAQLASILAVDAQHVTSLRWALRLDPVPRELLSNGMG
jgi:hypothetical protein